MYGWNEVFLYLWVGIIRARFVKFSFKFNICKVQLTVHCFKYFDDQTYLGSCFFSCCARGMRLAGLWETVKIVQVSLSLYVFAECISHFLNVPVPTIIMQATVCVHYPFPPYCAVSIEYWFTLSFSPSLQVFFANEMKTTADTFATLTRQNSDKL